MLFNMDSHRNQSEKIITQALPVITSDGFHLTASLFEPAEFNGKIVLISAASGIKQEFYYNFATYLTENGFMVYTYDYRGIGKSIDTTIKTTNGSYTIWGIKDYPAMVDYIMANHPDSKYYLIGHSFGGNGIGMSLMTNKFEKVITVASAITYWRYMPPLRGIQALFLAYIQIPLWNYLYGYFPARHKGLGENLPPKAASQWTRGLANKEAIIDIARFASDHYHQISTSIVMISIEDDWIGNEKGVDLLASYFTGAKVERRHLLVSETEQGKIGRINIFRKRFKTKLWPILLDYLK